MGVTSRDGIVGEIAAPADEAADLFSSLKTLLSDINVHRKVRIWSTTQSSGSTDSYTGSSPCWKKDRSPRSAHNHIGEKRFDSKPPDTAEQRCREGVKQYVTTFLLYSVLSTSQKIQEY